MPGGRFHCWGVSISCGGGALSLSVASLFVETYASRSLAWFRTRNLQYTPITFIFSADPKRHLASITIHLMVLLFKIVFIHTRINGEKWLFFLFNFNVTLKSVLC